MELPAGVRLHTLTRLEDERGSLCEIFSVRRPPAAPPLQWNLVRSKPRTLRGMHVHPDRADYVVVLSGRMFLGLRDIRPHSPTYLGGGLTEINANSPVAAEIPTGVVHGFFFPEGGIHAYGLSEYWRPHSDIGCRWDDADMNLRWPVADPVVNARDTGFGSFQELLSQQLFGSGAPG